MTKKIYRINLNEIDGLKIVCKNCGDIIFISFKNNKCVDKCAGCGKRLPQEIFWKAVESISDLVRTEKKDNIDIFIETEEDIK